MFCHMHYRSLVATQTGNLLLLIADWHDPRVENTIMRFFIYSIFLDRLCGCPPYQRVSRDSLLADQDVAPLFVVTLLIPLVSVIPPVKFPLLLFWDRDDDVDLTEA